MPQRSAGSAYLRVLGELDSVGMLDESVFERTLVNLLRGQLTREVAVEVAVVLAFNARWQRQLVTRGGGRPWGAQRKTRGTSLGFQRSSNHTSPFSSGTRRSSEHGPGHATPHDARALSQHCSKMSDRDKLNKAITLANAGDYAGAAKEMAAVSPESVSARGKKDIDSRMHC